MQTLLISVDGRVLRIAEEKVVKIGRSIDADVVLSSSSVSRAHAELRPQGGGWVLVDVGSSGGTFVGGQRVTEQRLSGPVQVQCGPPGPGSTLTITPESQAPAELTGARQIVPAGPVAPMNRFAPPPQPGQQPAAGPASAASAPPAPAPGQGAPPAPGAMPPPGGAPGAMPPPGATPGAMPPPRGPMPPPAGVPSPGGPPSPAGADSLDHELTVAPGSRPINAGDVPGQPTGPDLMIVAEGEEYRFRHPASISLGRHSECDVRVSDEAVSRHHAQITAVQGGWVFQNASEKGSYAKGKRIDNEPFDETLEVRLGHPTAGEPITLIPILSAEEELRRAAVKRRKKRLLIGGIAAALVLAIGAAIALPILLEEDAPPKEPVDTMAELTQEEADEVKSAAVFILIPDTSTGSILGSGSGSIVSEDGKIITNAHVADPGAIPEMGESSPEFVLVSLTDPANSYRASDEELYRARVLESDGERDVAVVQIYADLEGGDVDPSTLDLPVMPLGDSDEVTQGQELNVFGWPGTARSTDPEETPFVQPSWTKCTVKSIVPKSGDDRGDFNVGDGCIDQGNSGGSAVDNDGNLVGVPTSVLVNEQTGAGSGRATPLDFLADTLEAAGITVP